MRLSLFAFLFASSNNFARAYRRHGVSFGVAAFSSPKAPPEKPQAEYTSNNSEEIESPWNNQRLLGRAEGKNAHRARQHVNPLSNKFQQQTVLSPDWPKDTFDDMSRPLFLDIGCSRGGFLVDMATQRRGDFNYLGLEIRPIVVFHAQQRVEKHNLQGHLGFVGCNANVDLERLLTLADAKDNLKMVAIQFPDPHFKVRNFKNKNPDAFTTFPASSLSSVPFPSFVFLKTRRDTLSDELLLQNWCPH